MPRKYCFLNSERPCDATCKAAFEVDDPVENIDCYFVWLAYHLGEGLYEVKRAMERMGFPGPPFEPGGGGSSPKKPKGFPNN